jgi:hypothetical protein
MTRHTVRADRPAALRAISIATLLAWAVAACGSSASTVAPARPTNAPATPTAAASVSVAGPTLTAVAPTPSAAARTAAPVLANALAQLNALTSYKFKFTLQGGSYASSVGTGGVVGTVVNKPAFAVQFTYVDIEVIEIQGKNWTKNGSAWDLSPYPDSPTTYDSYGPAILLSHYFPASVAAYYTAVGDGAVNGVLVTHYTAAPQILSAFFAYWGVKGQSSQAADIWIAKGTDYPVRWKVTATGAAVVPGSGGSSDFEFLVDITKANDPGNVIHVPAS